MRCRWSSRRSTAWMAMLSPRASSSIGARSRLTPWTSAPSPAGRLSYRRAAELFTAATRPLAADGKGWVLHQLRHSA